MTIRAKCLIRCSTYTERFYELWARQDGEEMTIGLKKAVNFDGYSADAMAQYSTNSIKGKYKLINGVDMSCVHCNGESVVLCSDCGLWSCQGGSHLPCCGDTMDNIKSIDYITASNTDESENRPLLGNGQGANVPQPVNRKLTYKA